MVNIIKCSGSAGTNWNLYLYCILIHHALNICIYLRREQLRFNEPKTDRWTETHSTDNKC